MKLCVELNRIDKLVDCVSEDSVIILSPMTWALRPTRTKLLLSSNDDCNEFVAYKNTGYFICSFLNNISQATQDTNKTCFIGDRRYKCQF